MTQASDSEAVKRPSCVLAVHLQTEEASDRALQIVAAVMESLAEKGSLSSTARFGVCGPDGLDYYVAVVGNEPLPGETVESLIASLDGTAFVSLPPEVTSPICEYSDLFSGSTVGPASHHYEDGLLLAKW